jgi:hypothetical protein
MKNTNNKPQKKTGKAPVLLGTESDDFDLDLLGQGVKSHDKKLKK